MKTLSSLEVTTTSYAAGDEKVGIMTTLGFQWIIDAWNLQHCLWSTVSSITSWSTQQLHHMYQLVEVMLKLSMFTPAYLDGEDHFDGLVQERRNCSALAMELHLSCTNPLIWAQPCVQFKTDNTWCHSKTGLNKTLWFRFEAYRAST